MGQSLATDQGFRCEYSRQVFPWAVKVALKAASHQVVDHPTQQVVDGANSTKPVMQNHQRALVGGTYLIIEALQVFLDAVEFSQPVQVSLESSLSLGSITRSQTSDIPLQEAITMLWAVANLLNGVKDLLTLRQWMLSRSELSVVSDEDPFNILTEERSDVIRGGLLLRN
ncbi:hypothetical protein EFK68_03340 [Pseudomonas aeruginosa]|nr:hypothetical protein EFK68_03340 [Pseudomonas aeruginosa]